jgi:hypothetical protein
LRSRERRGLAVGQSASLFVACVQMVDDPAGNKLLLVMDYMEGGPVMPRDVLDRGEAIPEVLARLHFRDMCKVGVGAGIGASLAGRQLKRGGGVLGPTDRQTRVAHWDQQIDRHGGASGPTNRQTRGRIGTNR